MALNTNSGYECYLERPVTIFLKNNRYMYGTLKSYDQYNSIALNYAIERIFYKNKFAEKSHGLIIVRGENITLVGSGTNPKLSNLQKMDFDLLADEVEQENKCN